MNQPGPSMPMSPSPRQYPANLPNNPQYPMQPPQPPPFAGGPYMAAIPPMQPPYYYPPNPYQMAGPSNQMLPYGIPPPYYAPPPHQYMYPLPPPPHLSYPPSPRQFDAPRNSDYPRQNGGSPHRGSPRNFSQRNSHQQHLSPSAAQFRPAASRPAKLSSPIATIPSSPFPAQTATAPQHPPAELPPVVVDTAPPPAPDIPPPPPEAEIIPKQPEHSHEPSQPQDVPVESAEDVPSSSPTPVAASTPTPISEGPVGLSDAATATAATIPKARIAIMNTRPDDPSKAYGLMFSHRSKPPQSVIDSAALVEAFDPSVGERGSHSHGNGASRASHGISSSRARDTRARGIFIGSPEPAASSAVSAPSSDAGAAAEVSLPAEDASSAPDESSTSGPSKTEDLLRPESEKSFLPPVTPTLSSSVQSSTPVTPTTQTPSPSSPVSTATSISAQPSPSVSVAKVSSPAVTAPAVSPAPQTPQSRPAPKSWADLFAKKQTQTKSAVTSSTSATDVQAPAGESPNAGGAETKAADVDAPVASTSTSSSPSSHRKSPSTDRAGSKTHVITASDAEGSTPPLHVILTSSPPAHPPAPLTHPRGLVNTGNMCFANVVLQALLHSPPFYKLFDLIGRTLPADLGRRALVDATVVFLRDFPLEPAVPAAPEKIASSSSGRSTPMTPEQLRQQSWNQDSFIPQFLYDAMSENKRFDSMRGGRQEDAEEFLGFFLDTLHEELLSALARLQANPPPSSAAWAAASSSASATTGAQGDEREVERPLSPSDAGNGDGWLEVGKKNKVTQTRTTKARDSAITRIFGGKLRSTLHTPGNGKDSVTLEPYQPLQLDIQPDHVHTIEDALLHLTQPETVQVHSAIRGGLVDATKQVLIESLPPILVVHVKRFLYDVHGVQKSTKMLLYKTTLEVPRDVISPASRGAVPPRYRLYGVIYHHGKSATGGHYTIDLLRQDQSEWLRIDDTQIEVVSESDVAMTSPEKVSDKDRTPYLLFYQRIPEGPSPSSPSSSSPLSSSPSQRQNLQQSQRKASGLAPKGKAAAK